LIEECSFSNMMEDSKDSNIDLTLSLGTLAVIVLLVITMSGLVTSLSLYLWFRTVASQELHCGHCHSLLALQGVMQPPQSVPLQLPPGNYLATVLSPSDQQHMGRSDQYAEYQSATNQRLGMKGAVSNPGYENVNMTVSEKPKITSFHNGMPEPEIEQSVRVGVRFTASPSKMTPFSKQSESIIVHSKYPFHRTCSTRKKVLPRFHRAGNVRENSQPQQNWLDISQMCRTVLSRISPRQRFSKSGVMASQTRPVQQVKEEAIEHPVPPHNYIHPLNDVERYNALVLKTNIQSSLPPSSPYGYLTKGGDLQLHTAGYRQSWGSTLPEYSEFLI